MPTASGLEEVRWHFDKLVKQFGLPEHRVNGDLTLRDVIIEGIVATAVLDSVVCEGDEPLADDPWFDGFYGTNIGWVLRDVIVLPEPIPCKGAQGLWTVPDDVLAKINTVTNPRACRLVDQRMELLEAIKAAMRIEALWCPKGKQGSAEHEEEAAVLHKMRDMFIAVINKTEASK